ncbi:MAG: hypothetical protein NW200_08440 [Hyphomonadaceae bacterium]|nr:hypothetical protein [Hyphomonadaceae bacterium]
MRLAVILALFAASLWAPAASAQDAETRVYGAAQSCTGLRAYLRNYPNGRFVADARARIARDCAEAPAAATPAPAVRVAPADPCVQARADWGYISNTTDIALLRTYMDNAPGACAIQRAQAQARIRQLEGEQSAAQRRASEEQSRRAAWNGVPGFDGVWVDVSGGCRKFPWRFVPNGELIDLQSSGPNWVYEYSSKVTSTNPPTLFHDDGHRITLVSPNEIRREGVPPAAAYTCIARKQ